MKKYAEVLCMIKRAYDQKQMQQKLNIKPVPKGYSMINGQLVPNKSGRRFGPKPGEVQIPGFEGVYLPEEQAQQFFDKYLQQKATDPGVWQTNDGSLRYRDSVPKRPIQPINRTVASISKPR